MKSNRFGSGVVSKGANDILSPNTSHLIMIMTEVEMSSTRA